MRDEQAIRAKWHKIKKDLDELLTIDETLEPGLLKDTLKGVIKEKEGYERGLRYCLGLKQAQQSDDPHVVRK